MVEVNFPGVSLDEDGIIASMFVLEMYPNDLFEAEYRGRKVKLNKPMQGDVKKFKRINPS